MKLFRKGYDITLKRIKDTVRIKENGETLVLTVSADPMRIVSGLAKAQDKLNELTKDGKEPDKESLNGVAEFFASILFGSEQAAKLMAFYDNDAQDVVNVCGTYFRERLAKKITEAQKKHG